MQINFAHDRAVAIRIPHDMLRAIAGGQAKVIIQIARRARHSRAEKTVAVDFLGRDLTVRLSIQHDLDLFGVGPENANR